MTKRYSYRLFRRWSVGHKHLIGFDSQKIEEERASNMVRLFLKTYAAQLAKEKATNIEPRTAKGIVENFLHSAAVSKILHWYKNVRQGARKNWCCPSAMSAISKLKSP